MNVMIREAVRFMCPELSMLLMAVVVTVPTNTVLEIVLVEGDCGRGTVSSIVGSCGCPVGVGRRVVVVVA